MPSDSAKTGSVRFAAAAYRVYSWRARAPDARAPPQRESEAASSRKSVAELQQRDVVIIGGGHNGLVCAYYLAASGLSVTVLERRHVVGGAAVTEEFHPGFRNSVAAYTVSLLNPKII